MMYALCSQVEFFKKYPIQQEKSWLALLFGPTTFNFQILIICSQTFRAIADQSMNENDSITNADHEMVETYPEIYPICHCCSKSLDGWKRRAPLSPLLTNK